MKDSNYTRLFTGNFIIVQRVLQDLQDIGISAVVKDESESGRLAGFGASIQGQQDVYVNNDELDKAKAVVENINS